MKAPPTHLVRLKTLYTFECPHLDYSILLGLQFNEARANFISRQLHGWGCRLLAVPVQKTGGQ
jgi:hypothetical protein